MKRRTFIKASIALTGAGLVSYLVIPSFTDTLSKVLKDETARLNIDTNALNQFIKDANREQFWLKFSRSKKVLIILHTYAGILKGILPYRNKYLLYKGQIVGQFLMSTDLLLNKMDTSKQIVYTTFYNPYKQPCYNPFSVNHYPETA